MKKTILLSWLILCALLLVGCNNYSKPTEEPSESVTERNYNVPLSTGYTVELAEDGYYYVTLDDLEYYKRQMPGVMPAIYGESLNEIEERLVNNRLTDEDKTHCAKNTAENGRSKVCSFNKLYVPKVPDDMVTCVVRMGNSGNSYEYDIYRTDSLNGDVDTEYSGYSPIWMSMKFSGEEQYTQMYNSILNLKESYSNDYSGSYTLETSEKTVEVIYFGSNEKEYDIAMFFSEKDVNYIVYISGTSQELPPNEWILSIGCEKYVPQY